MRIGAVTHTGYTITANLSSQDVVVALRMQDHEAASLVSALLLALAQIDPVKWKDIWESVREELR